MDKTSTVSVRDLRRQARQLVARAARGERIVVTRYGTPRAVLGPCEARPERGPARTRPTQDEAFEREMRAFDRLLAEGRLDAHRGRWVAVRLGRVLDADPDAPALVRRLGRRLGAKVFFVGFVGSEEPLVDLPGQDLR